MEGGLINGTLWYVLVFQDYLTKWPIVFPMPDQKSIRIIKILAEEVIPWIGVPEALLSDRGTNLLSHLMDICSLMGIEKLNTTPSVRRSRRTF